MNTRAALRTGAVLALALLLASCAGPNSLAHTPDVAGHIAGFLQGVWNGLTFAFAFFISLFKHDVQLYDVHNNGGWYNWGFVLGNSAYWILITSLASRKRSLD